MPDDADIFAAGMEAFACGLLIKDCPYPRRSLSGVTWVDGYYVAMWVHEAPPVVNLGLPNPG
jgi:hypothetical protein